MLLPTVTNAEVRDDAMQKLHQKASEQRDIIDSSEDLAVLKPAIASFSNLQLVQLLPVAEDEDLELFKYMRLHADAARVPLEWDPACSHSSKTIGEALQEAQVPWSRFSSPKLSPQSANFLISPHPGGSLTTLASRLTCLTLHFDDHTDLDQKMMEYSQMFQKVFHKAQNMQTVHVGFPSHRPLSLTLETVFHYVTWPKLVAFGVQGWKLDGAEICDMALRHRDRLKGLRLRDVYLKEGSAWRDVLRTLRAHMPRLEWVSLRRIAYAKHFEEQWQGAEIPDDAPPGHDDSDTDIGEDDHPPGPHEPPSDPGDADADGNDDGTDGDSASDDEHGPDADAMDFPDLNSPATPTSAPWCNCNGGQHAPAGLHDDGGAISSAKRKAWEKWVLRRCPEHER